MNQVIINLVIDGKEENYIMSISIIIMGMVVGVLVGTTGIGGAALLTPFLLTVGITPFYSRWYRSTV